MNIPYLKSASLFILSILFGFLNDFILRYVQVSNLESVGAFQSTFLRFAFSSIFLLPFLKKGQGSSNMRTHIIRSLLLFFPMMIWTYGIQNGSLLLATFMEFSIPFFVSIIAYLALNESIKGRITSILLGLFGVGIVAFKHVEFNSLGIILLMFLAAILYATLDVVNKSLLNDNENIINMLFWSSVGVALLSLPMALCNWMNISFSHLILYVLQGLSGNLLIWLMLKAYQLSDISSLQPLRFISFPTSLLLSMKLGDKMSLFHFTIGIILLALSLIYSVIYEVKEIKSNG